MSWYEPEEEMWALDLDCEWDCDTEYEPTSTAVVTPVVAAPPIPTPRPMIEQPGTAEPALAR